MSGLGGGSICPKAYLFLGEGGSNCRGLNFLIVWGICPEWLLSCSPEIAYKLTFLLFKPPNQTEHRIHSTVYEANILCTRLPTIMSSSSLTIQLHLSVCPSVQCHLVELTCLLMLFNVTIQRNLFVWSQWKKGRIRISFSALHSNK